MIHVSRTPEFFNCGNMNLFPDAFSDHNLESMASSRTRQRSHSYYNAEGKKPYGVDTQKEETCLRPRSRCVFIINYAFTLILSKLGYWPDNQILLINQICGGGFLFWLELLNYIINIELNVFKRSFYSYETSELCSEDDIRHFTTSPTSKQMQSSLPKYQATKKEERDGDVSVVEFTSTKSKHKPNKQSPSRETCGSEIMFLKLDMDFKSKINKMKIYNNNNNNKVTCVCFGSGSKCHLKQVSMMTISEADNWEICSSSGMKYGQFVDWEKIDPEAAKKYQQILRSEHQQLKTMAREGFWAMPHTLRAKAYYHIIHSINSMYVFVASNGTTVSIFTEICLNQIFDCVLILYICRRAVTPDRDVYYELTKKLFGEQKHSSHPVPKYMEDGEIPR